jgi:hypothetical protein
MRQVPFACLAAAVLLAAIPLVAAQPPDAQEDAAWRNDPRDLSFASDTAGFRFHSARQSGLGRDSLDGSFDAASALLTLAFTAEAPGNGTLSGLDVAWPSLVEFRDQDGDGAYGLADQEIQRIHVAGLPSTVVSAPLVPAGRQATVTYALPANASQPGSLPLGDQVSGPQGTMRLGFSIVPRPALVDGAALDPLQLGMKVEVQDFPFKQKDTLLALEVRASTATPGGVQASLPDLVVRHGELRIRLFWAADAQADGAPAAAPATAVTRQPGNATVVLALPRSHRVAETGSFAVQRFPAPVEQALRIRPPGDWGMYAAGLATVGLLFGAPSLRRLRRP